MQVAIEFNDTLETEASTTMWGCTVLEGVDVVLDCLNSETALFSSLLQEYGVVNTLSSGSDLLTSHEEIVRVSEAGVLRVQHSVKGSGTDGVSIQHVEVSVILLTHNSAKSFLSLSAQILEFRLLVASLIDKLNTFTEVELKDGVSTLEFLEGVLIIDNAKFTSISDLHLREHEDEELTNQVEYFEVMVLEFHLKIETSEFTQVAVGVGVLGAENWSNFEDTLQITAESHLLVKLRGLSEASILLEVFEVEYVGTTFR